MPLYLVRRTNPFGAEADLDAAMFRTLVCTKAFPGLRWIRTYHTPGGERAYCVYEANSRDDVHRYSRAANVPYDEIIEVGELTRELYWTPEIEQARVPALAS